MEKNTARELVKGTLQNPFDKDRFIYFVKNLFNHIDESKAFHARGYVKEKFKQAVPVVKTYERVGTYTDAEGKKIDVLIVYLQKSNSLDRARTTLRNFAADYLKQRDEKDAGLVAFVSPDHHDWRLSLVKMEYKITESPTGKIKAKEEFTPAKRYSFLVGEHETSHTAQSRLVPIIEDDINDPTLKQLEDAFNIEKVTREFFGKYRELFLKLKESLDEIIKEDKKVGEDFKTKNVNTIDFAKKLLGQIVFLYFLQKKGWFGVSRGKDWGEGDKKFLRNLFIRAENGEKNYFNKFLEPLFYEALRLERPKDYYDQFNCRIPFLNGGLFDPISDYDWQDTDIEIPNDIFSNDHRTKEGDIGDGILDIFDRYNFTVKEDEPLEKEVAVDPEMLGKVFENLLEVKDRKSKGTYYTPREIVHYMCQESLVNYLATELEGKVNKKDIETLIKYGESVVEHDSRVVNKGRETKDYSFKLPPSVRGSAKLIDEKLVSIRICDPAVGSGAFPVGMMNEIIRTRNVLTNYLKRKKDRTIYNFKRHTIQNCLYGVDIDPGAVEIAKLRLWLSLIVDEEERETIQPLPNLDYKIMQGNSLLSVEKGGLFVSHWMKELEKVKKLFFNETSAKKKQEYKKQIDSLISQITNGHKDFDFEVYFSEVFHAKKGFDVVIANPPYIPSYSRQSAKMSREMKNRLKSLYESSSGRLNTFVLFIEKGTQLLRQDGLLCFIIPKTVLMMPAYKKCRELLLSNHLRLVLDCKEEVFQEVVVPTCVILTQREEAEEDYAILFQEYGVEGFVDLHEISRAAVLQDNAIRINITARPEAVVIINRLKTISKPLEEYCYVEDGINPGPFRSWLVTNTKYSDKQVKIIEGKNFHRYLPIKWQGKWFLWDKETIRVKQKSYPNSIAVLGDEQRFLMPAKIVTRQTADGIIATLDTKKFFCTNSVHTTRLKPNCPFDIKYILALLNCHLIAFYYKNEFKEKESTFPQVKVKNLRKLSIAIISSKEQRPFIDLVNEILAITENEDYLENPAKQVRVHDYEKQIDQLVYKLYGLTPEEIKIVESN